VEYLYLFFYLFFVVWFGFKSPGFILLIIVLLMIINNIVFVSMGLPNWAKIIFLIGLFLMTCLRGGDRCNLVSLTSWRNYGHLYVLGIIVMVVVMVLQMILFENGLSEWGQDKFANFLFPGVFLSISVFVLMKSYYFSESIMRSFLLAGIIFFVVFYAYDLSAGLNIYHRRDTNFVKGLNAIEMGRVAGLFCLVSILLFFFKKSQLYVSVSLFILSGYWVFMVGTRGAFVALIISVLIFYFYYENKGSRILHMSAIFIFMVFMLNVFDVEKYPLFSRLLELVQDDFSTRETSAGARVYFWGEAIDQFIQNPIMGIGFGRFADIYGVYPHNLFLEVLVEIGLIGFIGFLLMMYMSLKSVVFLLTSEEKKNVFFASLWVYYFVNSMFSGNLIINQEFFVMCGVVCGIKTGLDDELRDLRSSDLIPV